MNSRSSQHTIRDFLAGIPGVRLAYLFGSRVDGTVGPLSDYDVAVLADGAQDLAALRAWLAHELGVALETNHADVVLLNQAPVELAYAVVAQGDVVYQRDEATRVEYEAEVLTRYGDYLPVLRAQRQEISRGGERAARVQRYREALGRTERTLGEIRAAPAETQD